MVTLIPYPTLYFDIVGHPLEIFKGVVMTTTSVVHEARPCISLDTIDALSTKLGQLRALLLTISGSGFATFAELDDPEQGILLWLASDLAGSAKDALESHCLRCPVTTSGQQDATPMAAASVS
jgi:hypothetical protein